MNEPVFSESTWGRVFGLTRQAERQLAEELVAALSREAPGLLPLAVAVAPTHPMASLLAEGARGVDKLLGLLEGGSPRERNDALQMLALLLDGEKPSDVQARLRASLKKETEPEIAALHARALALVGDEQLMVEQLKRLGDDDPDVASAAARMLGFGRYRPAVAALVALVSRDHFLESRHAIWALGEIGDERALPALQIALAHAFRVVECLIALGKIGALASIPSITPMLIHGTGEQREAAARALSLVLDKNRDLEAALPPLRNALAPLLEDMLADRRPGLAVSTRFHLLLALARLGVKLDPARLRTYLGLAADDVSARAGKTRSATSVFNKLDARKRR